MPSTRRLACPTSPSALSARDALIAQNVGLVHHVAARLARAAGSVFVF